MNITAENINALMGATVLDPEGEKIGHVGQVFLDQISGLPSWVSVRTGLFGLSESFVPLDEADWDGEELQVPYAKSLVKDAPRVDVDNDEPLSATEEHDLYDHYGLRAEMGDEATGEPRFRRHVPAEQDTPSGNKGPREDAD